jgi:F-type H+-transporting ATPase subunit b
MDKLGIEPTLLLAQMVNFLIVVVVLSRFLYKPILSMLEKRKKEIEDGVRLTAKVREEETKFEEKKERMLATTRKEAQDILEEARKQAKVEEKEIIALAHKEAEVVMQKGKEDVARAKVEMEKSMRDSAVELAVAMTKRLLTSVLSPADQHKLITKHMKEIGSMKVS